jgi:adenosylcobinamide-GDP ribazoletransferase
MEDLSSQSATAPGAADSSWSFMLGARAAFAFLTRIPCGAIDERYPGLRWSAAWFPVVGFVLGFFASLLWALLVRAGATVAAVVIVAALALLTGAFHEDGLADTADAMGGARDRDKLLAILKDSRIGSFGAVALVLVLGVRVACLARLGPHAIGGLVLAETVSRAFPVWLMATLPYVTPSGDARSKPIMRAGLTHAIVATGFAGIAVGSLRGLGFFAWQPILLALGLASAATLLGRWRFRVRAGGITGDFLGATQQVTNALLLLGLALGL